MISLILDTNIWLYLCNGYDPISSTFIKNIHKNIHFELLQVLKAQVSNNEITILVNDIILNEFEKNKTITKGLIVEVGKEKKKILQSLKEIENYLEKHTVDTYIKEIQNQFVNRLEQKIERNNLHIAGVERFLYNNCIKIPVSSENYIDAAKLAIAKKAPFHNSKNNMADAIILLSAIEYLKDLELGQVNHAIFVSNNVNEYGSSTLSDEIQFHNDILLMLDGKNLIYKRHLAEALDLSESLTEDIRLYYQDLSEWRDFMDNNRFGCLLPHCNDEFSGTYGFFDSQIKFIRPAQFTFNPNQLTLFEFTEEERNNIKHIPQVDKGKCDFCKTTHVVCPKCKSLTCDPEDMGDFFCTNCESIFKIVYHNRLKEDVITEILYDY